MTHTPEERIQNLEAAMARIPSTRALVRFVLVMWVLSTAAIWFAAAAQAQMACGTRDTVIEKLGEKYGEVRRGGGLANPPTAIFEIWASDEGNRTWTILKTTPNGLTCVVAVGNGWQDDAGELTPTAGDPA